MNKENREISAKELEALDKDEYVIYDIRDEYSFSFGSVENAINNPNLENRNDFPKDKKIILCCKSGIISKELTDELCEAGFNAYNLTGGYAEWVCEKLKNEELCSRVTKSIQKKFHKELMSKFVKAINEYKLVEENDKIAVCISGGKDSMLMALLFKELKRYDKFPFEVIYLVMDPGYSKENRRIIEENGKALGIPLTFFETNIFDSVYNIEDSPCYLCARMRRGYLYSKARELGCNKIALGHHFDDVIETILMGMLYGGQTQTMMPKIHSTNFGEMTLIRPMYFIREENIIHWRDYNKLHFIRCACRFTDTCTTCNANGESKSKRLEIKNLIRELRKTNKQVEMNIFRSSENVNLKTILSYKDEDGKIHNFLDNF